MSDRYTTRYDISRPRSPVYNHARASLPIINLAYPEQHQHQHHHVHVVPASRHEIPAPRSNNSSIQTTGGTITTTYKVTADPLRGNSSVREGSRTRRSTLDNHNRPMNLPTIVTTSAVPRHQPVVHSAGIVRAASPMKDAYRSSQEDYVITPASSRHGSHRGHHHHKQRYSMTMDNGDIDRLAQEHGRLRIAPVRGPVYTSTRSRPVQSDALVRRDNVGEDYGEDGFVFTNPQDLVRYDLNNTQPPPQQTRPRRDSVDGRGGYRPVSVNGYHEAAARSYDTRERGPPPSTRGFDKIHGRTTSWDQGQGGLAMPTAPMPPQPPTMPGSGNFQRPSGFEPEQPLRRSSSNRTRPTSMYQDHDTRRASRDDRYEVREDESRNPRPHRDRYDDGVEERGFGLRPERIERPRSRLDGPDGDYADRIERPHSRVDRSDRYDRSERSERSERSDRPDKDRSEHKSRDAIATGLSLAGAALGLNAVKNAARDDRDERDDREEKDRRRERRDERESVDLSGRDPKERRRRDSNSPPLARDTQAQSSRDIPQDRELKNRSPPEVELPRERQVSKDDRDYEGERRERHRHRAEAAPAGAATGAALDSGSNSSEDVAPRTTRRRRESGATPGFNPKDAIDLKALKDQLNAQAPKVPPKEPEVRSTRVSTTKDAREASDIRRDLKNSERRSREVLQPLDNAQPRVVSPPREKQDEKPVKGILRQPKERFPEDPTPIREGVAPLKDAKKKDGIPPDARWTKISRKLVNPDALELGKERFEARDDFVIVLRVLTREEVQGYAEVTSKLRATREELEEIEALERRKKRRARHEEQKRERERGGAAPQPRNDREGKEKEGRRRRGREGDSSTDSEEGGDRGDHMSDRPKMLEGPKKAVTLNDALMTGGLGAEREPVSIPSRRDER